VSAVELSRRVSAGYWFRSSALPTAADVICSHPWIWAFADKDKDAAWRVCLLVG
jgi:hypothetical protein